MVTFWPSPIRTPGHEGQERERIPSVSPGVTLGFQPLTEDNLQTGIFFLEFSWPSLGLSLLGGSWPLIISKAQGPARSSPPGSLAVPAPGGEAAQRPPSALKPPDPGEVPKFSMEGQAFSGEVRSYKQN